MAACHALMLLSCSPTNQTGTVALTDHDYFNKHLYVIGVTTALCAEPAWRQLRQ